MCRYFGKEKIVGVYIEVEDGLRLERALKREQQQEKSEICRNVQEIFGRSGRFFRRKVRTERNRKKIYEFGI